MAIDSPYSTARQWLEETELGERFPLVTGLLFEDKESFMEKLEIFPEYSWGRRKDKGVIFIATVRTDDESKQALKCLESLKLK